MSVSKKWDKMKKPTKLKDNFKSSYHSTESEFHYTDKKK